MEVISSSQVGELVYHQEALSNYHKKVGKNQLFVEQGVGFTL